jgi:hypothetical protein
MPTLETFGMPTRTINKKCSVCGVGDLVMKFDMVNGHMNRVVCPVASCAYDVSDREFRAGLTEVMPVNCPDCGQPLVRCTKDIDSKFMGWVKCSNVGCANESSFADFKAASH